MKFIDALIRAKEEGVIICAEVGGVIEKYKWENDTLKHYSVSNQEWANSANQFNWYTTLDWFIEDEMTFFMALDFMRKGERVSKGNYEYLIDKGWLYYKTQDGKIHWSSSGFNELLRHKWRKVK